MGPRPADFDEQLIRQSPTFIKWTQMATGEKLRYACREFVKGHGDDQERLMRRIMIARRNNIRDHQTLKRARQLTSAKSNGNAATRTEESNESTEEEPSQKIVKLEDSAEITQTRKRRPSTLFSDAEVAKEMDVAAVEATRSYKAWMELKDGDVFVYNQKYVKGRDSHDWLLRKNIWRRMRYRRENKKMVETLLLTNPTPSVSDQHPQERAHHHDSMSTTSVASQIVDQTLLHQHQHQHPETSGSSVPESEPQVGTSVHMDHSVAAAASLTAAAAAAASPNGQKLSSVDSSISDAVEAAVAVAQSYAKSAHYTNPGATSMVHNPLVDSAANTAALDAAARLAATTANLDEEAVAAAAAAAAQPAKYTETTDVNLL